MLKSFTIATTVLSGSSYATISIVSSHLQDYAHCLDGKEGDSENCKQIKTAIQSVLKECYKGDTKAAFLIPDLSTFTFF